MTQIAARREPAVSMEHVIHFILIVMLSNRGGRQLRPIVTAPRFTSGLLAIPLDKRPVMSRAVRRLARQINVCIITNVRDSILLVLRPDIFRMSQKINLACRLVSFSKIPTEHAAMKLAILIVQALVLQGTV